MTHWHCPVSRRPRYHGVIGGRGASRVCKRWTNIILQHRYWLNKLRKHGIHIDHNIWNVLQEFENNKIVTCLFYASVYQEYCTLHTPVPKFLKSIPIDECEFEKCWLITEDSKKILVVSRSEISVCDLQTRNPDAIKNIKGLHLILKLLAARNVPSVAVLEYA